jgi:hypothetical protein
MQLPTATIVANYRALIAGIQANCPNGSFILRGQSYTATQAIALLTTLMNASLAELQAKSAWKDAMVAAEKAEATDGVIANELRQVLALSYVDMTTELAEFGLAPKKARKPLTTDARLAATAKLRATRKARGTMSKKQRLLITGDVTGVTITPVTEPVTAPVAAGAEET